MTTIVSLVLLPSLPLSLPPCAQLCSSQTQTGGLLKVLLLLPESHLHMQPVLHSDLHRYDNRPLPISVRCPVDRQPILLFRKCPVVNLTLRDCQELCADRIYLPRGQLRALFVQLQLDSRSLAGKVWCRAARIRRSHQGMEERGAHRERVSFDPK